MLATAESCTGGGIAYFITSIPGSSQWLERGFVTYSNEAKQEMLHVPRDELINFGAVSEEIAGAMAKGALENSHAAISVAVTGIAGPDGGSAEKPVGTVCFGWCIRDKVLKTTRVVFEGNRTEVREKTILMAMQGLIDMLEQ